MNNQSSFHFLSAFIAKKTLNLYLRTLTNTVMKNIAEGGNHNAAIYFFRIARFLLYGLMLQGKACNGYTGWRFSTRWLGNNLT